MQNANLIKYYVYLKKGKEFITPSLNIALQRKDDESELYAVKEGLAGNYRVLIEYEQ